MLGVLYMAMACHPVGLDKPDDSEGGGTGDSDTHLEDTQGTVAFDMLFSLADDQKVGRLHFAEGSQGPPEIVWEWSLRGDFPNRNHKPHGMSVVGDKVVVTSFDYFTDAFVVTLDLATGELLETILPSENEPWAGEPGLTVLRAAHNMTPVGDGWALSDTHNHRVLGLDAQMEFAWEISQDTVDDPYMSKWFSGPNDVETFDRVGETHLLVSARGDYFNHLLVFAPAEALRPLDPPWELTWRWPQEDDRALLFQNHNPHLVEDGLMVADSEHDRILIVNWEGEIAWEFPGADCPEGALDWPRDAMVAPDGALFISDTLGDQILAVKPGAECIDEDTVLWRWNGVHGPYQLELL